MSASLFIADKYAYLKHYDFTNPMDNLSKVLGGKVHKHQTFFFYTFRDVNRGVKVLLMVVTFISLKTASLDVKNSNMAHVLAVTGKVYV